jgi:membrane-bound serine protease (ClpP class)
VLLVGAIALAVFVLSPVWDVVVVGVAAVVEAAETYLWIRLSRRWRVRMGPETLIGARASVVSDCAPVGQVRLQGELWQARCEAGAGAGSTVRVVGRDGLTLDVEPA